MSSPLEQLPIFSNRPTFIDTEFNMAINSDIRDQAYQFFVEEVPELLHILETGLLNLSQDHSTAKIHDLMRAAHSLKGGAAGVGLDAIATLAHRLETLFRACYGDTVVMDSSLEDDMLQAYDCLRFPLVEQISRGSFDAEAALAAAEPVFAQVEARFGDALNQAESYIPSSSDLGVNMVESILEVDIAQGVQRLQEILSHPQDYEIAGELRAQVEVFAGFAEMLNLRGFDAIAKATQQALDHHPEQAIAITQQAMMDFEAARQTILSGADASHLGPSKELVALASSTTDSSRSLETPAVSSTAAEPVVPQPTGVPKGDLEETLVMEYPSAGADLGDIAGDIALEDGFFETQALEDEAWPEDLSDADWPELDVPPGLEADELDGLEDEVWNDFDPEQIQPDVQDAQPYEAAWSNAELDRAEFSATEFDDAEFDDTKFDGTEFDDAGFSDAEFDNTEFDEATSDDAGFSDAEFDDTEFDEAEFSVVNLDAWAMEPSAGEDFEGVETPKRAIAPSEAEDERQEGANRVQANANAEPLEAESLEAEPSDAESLYTEPSDTEPPDEESLSAIAPTAEPLAAEPANLDRLSSEPLSLEPLGSEAFSSEALSSEAFSSEPSNPEPHDEPQDVEWPYPDDSDVAQDIAVASSLDALDADPQDAEQSPFLMLLDTQDEETNLTERPSHTASVPEAGEEREEGMPATDAADERAIPENVDEMGELDAPEALDKEAFDEGAFDEEAFDEFDAFDFTDTSDAIHALEAIESLAPSHELEAFEIADTKFPSTEDAGAAALLHTGTSQADEETDTDSVLDLEDLFSEEQLADDSPHSLSDETIRDEEKGGDRPTQPPADSPPPGGNQPPTLEAAVQAIEAEFEQLPTVQDAPAADIDFQTYTSFEVQPSASGFQENRLVPALPQSQPMVKRPSPGPLKSPQQRTPRQPQPSSQHMPRPSSFTIRVDADRLERMNNLVGEFAINRDSLSLQNEQLQNVVKQLLSRFARFQDMAGQLRDLSDRMIVESEQSGPSISRRSHPSGSPGKSGRSPASLPASAHSISAALPSSIVDFSATDFDSLEMDRYGAVHSQLQEILEDIVQLEEAVDDITLFAQQSDQALEKQRHMLTRLRDELIWARMLPLSEILNRFPRILRDLANSYRKPVELKLSGAGVLVDKAILEKLYDPLLHLLRNAFDHGIEPIEQRKKWGKPTKGHIEIRAYHKGNQTVIEVKDDGQGLDLERIRKRALELGWASAADLANMSPAELVEYIFEPGFSTARQVSELSGRGVGLDVVQSQLKSIKGTITINSSPGQGTTFTLYLPLTLTIVKLIICLVDSIPMALPADSIEEVLTPQPDQIKQAGQQRFLYWKDQTTPIYRLADLLSYACPLPSTTPTKALATSAYPGHWLPPLLILRQDDQFFALEVDRLVNEQELVIKSFGSVLAAPSYTYGCTILGDGNLIPVIDGATLLDYALEERGVVPIEMPSRAEPPSPEPRALLTGDSTNQSTERSPRSLMDVPTGGSRNRLDVNSTNGSGGDRPASSSEPAIPTTVPATVRVPRSQPPTTIRTIQTPTVLVVDDAIALRRTLALSLEKSGFRVIQARDGQEAIDQLRQNPDAVELIVCDIEMPNMNGFEFLSYRRQHPNLTEIPVVMLTSRSNDKHRWLAMQLGATAYFTKPYLEQKFLSTLKDILD